jgi:hypothetical protein
LYLKNFSICTATKFPVFRETKFVIFSSKCSGIGFGNTLSVWDKLLLPFDGKREELAAGRGEGAVGIFKGSWDPGKAGIRA